MSVEYGQKLNRRQLLIGLSGAVLAGEAYAQRVQVCRTGALLVGTADELARGERVTVRIEDWRTHEIIADINFPSERSRTWTRQTNHPTDPIFRMVAFTSDAPQIRRVYEAPCNTMANIPLTTLRTGVSPTDADIPRSPRLPDSRVPPIRLPDLPTAAWIGFWGLLGAGLLAGVGAVAGGALAGRGGERRVVERVREVAPPPPPPAPAPRREEATPPPPGPAPVREVRHYGVVEHVVRGEVIHRTIPGEVVETEVVEPPRSFRERWRDRAAGAWRRITRYRP